MTNIVGIVDPITERKRQFIASVRPQLSTFPWLKYDEIDHGIATIAWAAIPTAPVSIHRSPDDALSFVLGTLYDKPDKKVTDAEYILNLQKANGVASLGGQNGYYLAFTLDRAQRAAVGTDILGLFPLYYYCTPNFLIFSTIQSVFRHFPQFSFDISSRGLAGILLTMHMTGRQPLLKHVRRPAVGRTLCWQERKGGTETPSASLKPSSAHFGDTYEEHLERFNSLLQKALSKAGAGHQALLLSGGLDSRLLAGYLGKMQTSPAVAVTLGNRSDNEMRFATRVAKTLEWPQCQIGVDFTRFPEFARKLVELEHLASGFTDLSFFQAAEDFQRVSPQIVTGFAGDIVMGGSHIQAGYDAERREHSFAAKFNSINRYGFSPDQIKKLVHPDILGEGLQEALEDLQNNYYSIEGLPFQRTWMFDMNHRVRFHTAASIVWRISFGAWPIMPYVDKEILDAAFGMPAASLMDRRAQIDLLRSRFPSLAALPLDRLTLDTTPLLPSFYRRILSSVSSKTGYHYRRYRAIRLLVNSNYEPRYYFRVFDINNPGWTAVRKDVEQYRVHAGRIFNPKTLNDLLPPPHVPIQVPEATVDSSSRKLLVAFMLWAGTNL
jgi:asparagine synthase (glutamine-hydrolysing)